MNRFDFSKSKIFLTVIIFAVTICIFAGCSFNEKNQEETTVSVNAPEIPLKPWNDEYLYEDIPAPKNADVYVLTQSYYDSWKIYSFSFENFTMEEAKEYISLLESSIVTREHYDEYYKNEIPMLNYMGYVNDSLAVTISQCGESGGMTVNVKAD